ncbi:MAG: alanine racemase [Anaerolineae bacterium]|nr:alanine racemase [Anaerolineae bacterium]
MVIQTGQVIRSDSIDRKNGTGVPSLTYAEIDLGAIAENTQALKQYIGPDVRLIAVVKANAYGHGAVEVARTALAHGAEWLGVGRLDEGVALRDTGIDVPILVLSYTSAHEVRAALDYALTLTVAEIPVAEAVSEYARQRNTRARAHVKVDTGMGRYGLLPDEVVPFFERVAALPGLEIEGIYSHFATADVTDKTYAHQQFDTFQAVLGNLAAAGHRPPVRHIANSAGTLDLPTMHLDAVRTGLALYGMYPSVEVGKTVPLKPALTLKSRVARVRTLPAGASISYGRTYITPRAMPVALVPVGYGDGYHRVLSNRGAVLINGQRAPIVGRVCMDQFVVDISGAGHVAVDDEVVLLGAQGNDRITAEEIADWAETLNYQVTTALMARVPRVFMTGNA